MTERATLLQELETLPPEYLGEVLDFVGYIKQKKQQKKEMLRKAAQMAVHEYGSDKELTAFSALDGEDCIHYSKRS